MKVLQEFEDVDQVYIAEWKGQAVRKSDYNALLAYTTELLETREIEEVVFDDLLPGEGTLYDRIVALKREICDMTCKKCKAKKPK